MVKSKITFENLYARKRDVTSLRQFTALVCDSLGFGSIEEHYSANYWGEQYFVAHESELSLTLAASDEKGFSDYAYWISLKGPQSVDNAERAKIGDELARRLTLAGFEVARPYSTEDWWAAKPVVRRIIYRNEAGTENEPGKQVETTVEEIRVKS